MGSDIEISWSPPDDGGTSISAYTIYIQNVDGAEYSFELDYCDGSDETIVADRACLIPNEILNSSPFNLLWGNSVYVKFTVTNIYGTSPISPVGNGATLVNGPTAPLNFAEDRTLTTGYTIGLVWDEGVDNGGTPVLDYAVWGD
jgi:hypothetical protein